MKTALSSRSLTLLFAAVLIVSIINTSLIVYSYLATQDQRNQDILNQNRILNQTITSLNQTDYIMQNLLEGKIDNVNARLPIAQYDYVIYRYWDYTSKVSIYMAKNGRTGAVDFNSTDAEVVFEKALSNGKSLYVKSDEYNLTSNINLINKKNARIDSDGAILMLNGNKIVVYGNTYQDSQNNQISGLVIINGTVHIENSFRTTVTNMIFQNSIVGLELANTNTWSEATKIDTVHFDKCAQGIVFRTNTSILSEGRSTTGSYANTEINRCYFNQLDNSVAVTVEENAEFTDSQMQDVRIWIGEFGKFNQTGLLLEGSMYKTSMDGVVFESFASQPLTESSMYAIKVANSAQQSPIIGGGVNFLGNWTARISNLYYKWIYGLGGVFKMTDIAVPIGFGGYGSAQIIEVHPATIASFNSKITVDGSFSANQTVTVRFRLEFVDNVVSDAVEKSFANGSSLWLNNDDFLRLYAYPNVIYAILVDAKLSPEMADAQVRIDLYGTTT